MANRDPKDGETPQSGIKPETSGPSVSLSETADISRLTGSFESVGFEVK